MRNRGRQQIFTKWRAVRLLSLTFVFAVLTNYVLMAAITWTPNGPLKSLLPKLSNQTYRFGSLETRMIDFRDASVDSPHLSFVRWQSTPLIDVLQRKPPAPATVLSTDIDLFVANITDSFTTEAPEHLPLDEILGDLYSESVEYPHQPLVTLIAVGWPMRSLHATTSQRWNEEFELTSPAWPTFTHTWISLHPGAAASEAYSAPVWPLWSGFAVNTLLYWLLWIAAVGLPLSARPLWRAHRGRCARCGYDFHGITADRCPECGTLNAAPAARRGAAMRSGRDAPAPRRPQ